MTNSRTRFPFITLDPAVENQVPVTFDSALVKDSGFIMDHEITRDTRPTLNGYAGRGVTLEFYQDGVLVGSVITDSKTGYFEFSVPQELSGGNHQFIAQVAGIDAPSEPFNMVIQDPNFVPVTLGEIRSGREFIFPEEPTEEKRPTFSGKGKPGSVVEIFDNGELIGSAVVGINKKWTFTPNEDMASGEHDIVVKSGLGNESYPTHLTIAGDVPVDSETVTTLNFQDVIAEAPSKLFPETEINVQGQKQGLVITSDDMNHSLTNTGVNDHAPTMSEYELQQIVIDVSA